MLTLSAGVEKTPLEDMVPEEFDLSIARQQLQELVDDFRRNLESGALSHNTSERDIHRWVDRLLDVLGWNVDDPVQYSREAFTRGAGFADAVLMSSGSPVCYLEAKRLGRIPSANVLSGERRDYSREEEQALKYARRGVGLPENERWAILSNFEKLYLFEATSDERLMAFESPEELVERFDEETRFLIRNELLDGGLIRWLHRRGRPDVDEEFRNRLNVWRVHLAQDIYDRNREGAADGVTPDVRLLQRAVQRLLDRLVVLQYATDLEAIPGEPLRELLDRTAPSSSALVRQLSLSDELLATFERFDGLYNTTIFAPGHISEQVTIGDSTLRDIVDEVASQNFRRFSSDILGTTYETYLAQELEIREPDIVRLAVRPEIRRAGGIYYTPPHVVKHIVHQVLDPLLENASAEDVASITVIDPACGSGSFLVAAFERLVMWYEEENLKRREAIRDWVRTHRGQASLGEEIPLPEPITDFHRSILENNLYGVDLDPDAAELSAINLIIAAIHAGMAGGTLEKLPAVLGQNIKVGNSVLPGVQALPQSAFAEALEKRADDLRHITDLRRELQLENVANAERELIQQIDALTEPLADALAHQISEEGLNLDEHRAFVWMAEFPEIFKPDKDLDEQGFDCVIGNPPWIGFTGARETRPYLSNRFETCTGRFDMYVPFVELGLRLLRRGGRFGMITPSNYFLREYGIGLRRWLAKTQSLESIVDFGDRQLFHGATNYSAILIARRELPPDDSKFAYRRKDYEADASQYYQRDLTEDVWHFLSPEEKNVFSRMTAAPSKPLSEVCVPNGIMEGIVTGQNRVFVVSEERAEELDLDEDIAKGCPRGQFIKKWRVLPGSELVIYPYKIDATGRTVPWEEHQLKTDYPTLYQYLSWARTIPSSEGGLAGRTYFDESGKEWWELWNQRDKVLLDQPKIVSPEVAAEPNYAVVGGNTYVPNSASALILRDANERNLFFVLGLLNSRILGQFHRRRSVPKANGYLIYLHAFLKDIPIRFPEGKNAFFYEEISRLAERCVDLARRRETLELDFNQYIQEYELHPVPRGRQLGAGSVGSWIREVPAQDLDVSSISRGKLYSVSTQVTGPWLIIEGRVRLAESEYSAGEYDTERLVRVKLPEQKRDFLAYYLPWIHRRMAFSTSPRLTLYQKLLRHPLPRFPRPEDEHMNMVLSRYRPLHDKYQKMSYEIANDQDQIDRSVQRLYGLSDDDLAVLDITPPAETG